jgi:hypothetical protein
LTPARQRSLFAGRSLRSLSWVASIILFAVPAVLLIATVIASRAPTTQAVALTVIDQYSQAPIANAQVVSGERQWQTDASGQLELQVGQEPMPMAISAPGYGAVSGHVDRAAGDSQQVMLRPTLVRGRVTETGTDAPIPNAVISVVTDAGVQQTVTTGADGTYEIADVPPGARLTVESPDHAVAEQAIDKATVDWQLARSVVTGTVRNQAGDSIVAALVSTADGAASTETDAEGAYRLNGLGSATELLFRAPGYAEQRLGIPETFQLDAALEAEQIKAVYANFSTLADPERLGSLIEIAETTEVNAIVIDVKQDTIYYDTQVPFFRDIPDMLTPVIDPAALNEQLHEIGIYTIARVVVFKDPVVAEARPDLAVRDEVTGGSWRDMNGSAWVNAFNEELWAANADLAVELANLGFDEIQYDYIRFPSDGDLRTADFGREYTEAARRTAISGAVALAQERLRPTGAKFSIDLFPIIALFGDDQGIGQTLQDLTPLADYVSLMIYPSHYERGNIPVDGHPNDFPAETVTYTLERAEELVPGTRLKMRPWLQDFDYPLEGYSKYGPEEVRVQIEAAEAFGTSGWILWNAAGQFQTEALAPTD